MYRYMHYSQLRQEASEGFRDAIARDRDDLLQRLEAEGALAFSLFISDRNLCVYAETAGEYEWEWPASYDRWLEPWPGQAEPTLSARLLDIFHDGVPTDVSSWRGNRIVERRIGSIARLKPEMAASYIFYHYQLQEEKPEGFNKTYIIGAHGTFLFSYQEVPAVVSETKRIGALSTTHSPSNWQEVMHPHFEPWVTENENEKLWRVMEQLI